jgi:WD40 repeat protein
MNGNILVSTVGGYLHVLDRSTGTRIRTLSGHKHEVISAVFSPNNSVAASTSSDCTIRIWDVSTGACLKTLQGHTGPVNSSAFSSDGSLIASASSDQTVRVWDYASGVCIYTLRGHSDSVNSVSFSPDGQFIVSASRDKRVIIWDTSSGSCIRMLSEHSIQASSFSGMYPHLYESNHSVTELGNSIYCIGGSNSIIREILLLPRGQSITREPWDEVEARKPYHEIRWKFTYGPKDAWRWCHVVDPETGAIHPPELAAVPGAFSGPEVGPV